MAVRADTQPVLIIEDDRNTAHLVSLYLDREGFKPVIAHDGREGLKLAERRVFLTPMNMRCWRR